MPQAKLGKGRTVPVSLEKQASVRECSNLNAAWKFIRFIEVIHDSSRRRSSWMDDLSLSGRRRCLIEEQFRGKGFDHVSRPHLGSLR